MASGAGRTIARIALGGALVYAGVSHLSFGRKEFRAQVPEWVPLDADTTVVASGVAEIALGAALVSGWRRKLVGNAAAAFFVAVFPGNVSQWVNERDGFGLDTDGKRLLRLPFQIPLIVLAIWSTRTPRSQRD